MKKIITCIVFILIFFYQPVIAKEIRTTLKSDDGKDIIYYVIQRDNKRSKDLLVLLQGSTCQSAINNKSIIKNFGSAFPENDILLVEKFGIDGNLDKNSTQIKKCPQIYIQNDSPIKRAKDYFAVLNLLRDKYRHIVLIGGSEGAIITNLITANANTGFITAAISMNAGGRFFIDDVIHSIKQTAPPKIADEQINDFKAFAKEVLNRNLRDSPSDQTASEHGATWWYESLSIDNQKLIQSSKTPLLVLQTLSDNNVDGTGAQKMIAAIKNPMVSFKFYKELDHHFKDSDGNRHTSLIVKDIQDWYRKIQDKPGKTIQY
ncbi:hypothetical protein [Xenorhabdus thuongxuanensis]|uniref:BAAT/Acyl-CoA thioester hydrolase C-terminal domain-containing protein n=1 Tax=Xenorhabdus thuongxuanensis TaxID=1873484 RepID=A0A1Q5TZ27_9GAMM|nr:hypothetical protein [Xenorhabdus thuongxuanensis]OKP05463.1 hypothetical protein Xentx_02379 [Xenorhabdus thuongxuanensis]